MAKADELSCDFETFCALDLKKVGAHKYAMHPSADVLCLAYAFNEEEPDLWLPGMPIPDRVFDHLMDDGLIRAWNAEFERLFFAVMARLYGWPEVRHEQFYCTMTEALAMGMPGQLSQCSAAMGLPQRKDDAGRRIMLQLCRPRKPTKKNPSVRFTPENAPGKFQILYDYCKQDVRVEQAIKRNVVRLKPLEQRRYWLAAKINERGVPIDLDLIEKAQAVVDQHTALLDQHMSVLTDGEVTACSQTKALTQWLGKQGLMWPENEMPSVAKDPVFRMLARDDLTYAQREALILRQEAGKTSTAKLGSFRDHMCEDGTVKGTLQFNGASTGRDAARGVQVQNFPRPNKKTNISAVIRDILDNGFDSSDIEFFHGKPLSIVADILRSCIAAPYGEKFYSCDASQIEARMTAWLAGEQKKLDAFMAYDRKEGPDIYTVAAAGIYNVPPERIDPDGEQRQTGKVSELALGFGGGVGAYASMAKIYQLDLRKAFAPVWSLADSERRSRALDAWGQRGKGSGMAREAWLASELIKVAWRIDNPHIRDAWPSVEEAAISAMKKPGHTYEACKLKFKATGSFLRMELPSGRPLWFPFARLVWEENAWGKKSPKIYFKAVDGFTRQWREFSIWGGTLFQNGVQAASRDVLFDAVDRLEDAGYPNIFRVHDEVINQTPATFGDMAKFRQLFIQQPAWAPGLPINGSGWEGERYRK